MSINKKQLTKRLLDIKEAAEYLGRSVWSIRELQYDGVLPFVKIGRRVHFDIFDLDRVIDQHKTRYTY